MLFNTILGIESMAIVTKSIGSIDYRKYSEEDFLSKLDLGSELFNEDLIKTKSNMTYCYTPFFYGIDFQKNMSF